MGELCRTSVDNLGSQVNWATLKWQLLADPCPWRICFGLLPWIRNNQMENISFWLKNDHTLLLFSVIERFPVERYGNYILIGGHKEIVTKFLLLQWPLFPRSSVCIHHPIAILDTSRLSRDLTFYFSSYWGTRTPKSCKDRWKECPGGFLGTSLRSLFMFCPKTCFLHLNTLFLMITDGP